MEKLLRRVLAQEQGCKIEKSAVYIERRNCGGNFVNVGVNHYPFTPSLPHGDCDPESLVPVALLCKRRPSLYVPGLSLLPKHDCTEITGSIRFVGQARSNHGE